MSQETENAILELHEALKDAEPDPAKRMEFLREVNAAFDGLSATRARQPQPLA